MQAGGILILKGKAITRCFQTGQVLKWLFKSIKVCKSSSHSPKVRRDALFWPVSSTPKNTPKTHLHKVNCSLNTENNLIHSLLLNIVSHRPNNTTKTTFKKTKIGRYSIFKVCTDNRRSHQSIDRTNKNISKSPSHCFSLQLTSHQAYVITHQTFTISMVHILSYILKTGLCFVRRSWHLWTSTFSFEAFEDGGSVYPIDFIKLSLR